MERKIIETGDGSKTIQLVDWNEQYHSVHGALQEAKHVFIDQFTQQLNGRTEIDVFEMGFGTGLNAYLTFEAAKKMGISVRYFSLEAYPVAAQEYEQLDYEELLNDQAGVWQKLMAADWACERPITPHFTLHKHQCMIEEWTPTPNAFDFIFYDAFGPRVQPHLWTPLIFQKLFDAAKTNGIFLTYCAKGQVRRDLAAVGFDMHRLPGPPGKREMLMGFKK